MKNLGYQIKVIDLMRLEELMMAREKTFAHFGLTFHPHTNKNPLLFNLLLLLLSLLLIQSNIKNKKKRKIFHTHK